MFLPAERVPSATRQVEELELAALDGVTALPGADVLLQDLPTNRWADVTSGSQRLMRARLAAAGLPVPAVLIAAEDVSEGKPDPEGYLAASAALGCDIVRCVVIEDSAPGVAAARWALLASWDTLVRPAPAHQSLSCVATRNGALGSTKVAVPTWTASAPAHISSAAS